MGWPVTRQAIVYIHRAPTMKKKPTQPGPKPFIGWALYNWGIARGAFTSRRQAVESAENSSGKPWKECREYFRIAKVRVTVNGNADAG